MEQRALQVADDALMQSELERAIRTLIGIDREGEKMEVAQRKGVSCSWTYARTAISSLLQRSMPI